MAHQIINRRNFLALSAAGATAAALGSWLTATAGDDADPIKRGPGKPTPPDPLATSPASKRLKKAYRTALKNGKPLLVFVDPTIDPPYKTDEQRMTARQASEYGHALGIAINNADNTLLADLALCEVVCTRAHDLRHIAGAADIKTPLMVMIEQQGGAQVTKSIEIKLGDEPSVRKLLGKDVDYKEATVLAEKAVKARNKRIADVLHGALAKDRKMLERRANENVRAIGSAPAKQAVQAARAKTAALTNTAPGSIQASTEATLAAAPSIRLAAETDAAARAKLLGVLVSASTEAIKKNPPPGAKWAQSWGCGVTIEGDKGGSPGYACGMGHCAPLSSRFLMYFTGDK